MLNLNEKKDNLLTPFLISEPLLNEKIMKETMEAKKIYSKDLLIAKAIIARDSQITFNYLYEGCYPMFKAIFNNYYTDCQNCKEFIDEIYILIMTPGVKSGKAPLSNYRGESSLKTWLRTACISYCYERFRKKINIVDINEVNDDRNQKKLSLIDIMGAEMPDLSELHRQDEEKVIMQILNRINNTRYREILRLRIIEKKSHQEIAESLGMTLPNYYNKRKLAQAQYDKIREEVKL